jgi:hypothetical protein
MGDSSTYNILKQTLNSYCGNGAWELFLNKNESEQKTIQRITEHIYKFNEISKLLFSTQLRSLAAHANINYIRVNDVENKGDGLSLKNYSIVFPSSIIKNISVIDLYNIDNGTMRSRLLSHSKTLSEFSDYYANIHRLLSKFML